MEWDGKTERRNGLNHIKELMDVRIQGAEKALSLQAKEYERRLADLNGEAQRLRDMQATYLPRETYNAQHRYLEMKIDTVQKLLFIGMGILIAVEFVLRFFSHDG